MALSYQNYTGDNVTDTFAIPFTYTDTSEISVTVDGVAQTGLTFPSASTVQLTSPPATSTLVQVRRATDLTARSIDYVSGSVLTEEDLDNANIQVFHASQEAVDTAGDAVGLDSDDKMDAQSKVIKNVADPVSAQDAVTKNYLENTWLTLDDKAQLNSLNTTNLDTVATDITNVNTVATNIADVNTVAGNNANVTTVATDIANVNTVAADLNEPVSEIDTVANNITNVNTVGGISTDVTTVAGISSDVTAVAADATDIGTVSTNIANVNTVAGISSDVTTVSGINAAVSSVAADATDIGTVSTNIANVNTVAGISADVTTVAADGTDIGTVATNISNVNTVAGISGNVTTVAGISADVTAVAGISGDIQDVQEKLAEIQAVADDLQEVTSEIDTVANSIANVDAVGGSIANVNTVAGISSDVTTVAGNSSDISTVAGISSDVSTVAANNANVTTVASNITGVNSFAERYRVDTTDPTTSLDEGDLAYNTTDNALKYYNGTSWASITAGLTDIVGDVTPQLGGNLDTNGNDINFGDNDKAVFGAGSDLRIYSDGANALINHSNTLAGALYLMGDNNVIISNQAGTENKAVFTTNGAVTLYYDNATKISTTATGADITGTLTASEDVKIGPGRKLYSDGGFYLDCDNDNSGIGTSVNISTNNTANLLATFSDNGDVSLYADDGTTQGFYWDASTQRLGLGDTAPPSVLSVYQNDAVVDSTGGITIEQNGTGDSRLRFLLTGVQGYTVGIDNSDSDKFKIGTSADLSTNNLFTITSGGDVGIGTSSPALNINANTRALSIYQNSSDGAGLGLVSSNCTLNIVAGNNASYISNETSDPMIFRTNATEAMRIDSSGNVVLNNASYLQFKDSGGTARDVLAIDGFNGLNINSAGGGASAPIVFKENGSEIARFDTSGNLLVGTTSTSTFSVSDGAMVRQSGRFLGTTSSDSVAALSRRGTDGSIVAFYKNTSLVGSISVTGSGVTYNTTSDLRLKENIEPLVATDKLMAMNPVSYNWKADPDGPRSMGFIAQEMQEVMPEAVAVGDDEDAMMSMDYGRITPILVSALQDAHRKIEELEQRIADMEAK